MAVPAGRPRRPTGTRRPRASHVHVQNEPVGPDGTKGRATLPRSAARRRRGQVGDSCLRHGTWRCDLFSFCCPRLRCVRPPEAAAVDSAAAIALAARIDTQGAHHARPHKAVRRTQRHAAAIGTAKRLANVTKLKRARRRFDVQRAVRGSRGVARRHRTGGQSTLHRCTAIDLLTIGRHGARQRTRFSHCAARTCTFRSAASTDDASTCLERMPVHTTPGATPCGACASTRNTLAFGDGAAHADTCDARDASP